jgi:hypothetical protein
MIKTAADIPAPPTALGSHQRGTEVDVRWDAPDARGAPVQGYRLRISVVADGVAKETESVDVKPTTYTLRHIRPNTDYALQVEVRNHWSHSTGFPLLLPARLRRA